MSLRGKIIFRLILLLSVLFLGLILYMYLESRMLKVTEIEVKSVDIPTAFQGKKIVFVADIHHGPYFSKERLTNLVDRINLLEPDIIILGGDYVHREPIYIHNVFNEFRRLKAPLGIYAVQGNHDHWEDAIGIWNYMHRNGIHICDNESFWVKSGQDSIKIGGVGDLWTDNQEPQHTISDVRDNQFCILISHNPDYLEEFHSNLVDLTLSGHTHGGQVNLFGWAPILPSKYGQKYRYGLIKCGKTLSYITSGVGTITPPLRFMCVPEIVLIRLKY